MSVNIETLVEHLEKSSAPEFTEEEWQQVVGILSSDKSHPDILAAQYRLLSCKPFYLYIRWSIEKLNFNIFRILFEAHKIKLWGRDFTHHVGASPLRFVVEIGKDLINQITADDSLTYSEIASKLKDALAFANNFYSYHGTSQEIFDSSSNSNPYIDMQIYIKDCKRHITINQMRSALPYGFHVPAIELILAYSEGISENSMPEYTYQELCREIPIELEGSKLQVKGNVACRFICEPEVNTQQFKREMQILYHTWHPNIFRPTGICITNDPVSGIFYKAKANHIPNTSLSKYLKEKSREDFSPVEAVGAAHVRNHNELLILELGLQCAEALFEFHINGLIYRNLSIDTIYVDSPNAFMNKRNPSQIRLGYFDLERYLNKGDKLDWLNCPPEYFDHVGHPSKIPFTPEGDVYSFGGILYSLITKQKPWEDQLKLNLQWNWGGKKPEVIKKLIQSGERPKFPSNIDAVLKLCIEQCWAQNPLERPKMPDLIKILAHLLQKESNKKFAPIPHLMGECVRSGARYLTPAIASVQAFRKQLLSKALKSFGEIDPFEISISNSIKALIVHRPGGNILFVSSGLSDPNQDPNRHFPVNYEIAMELDSQELFPKPGVSSPTAAAKPSDSASLFNQVLSLFSNREAANDKQNQEDTKINRDKQNQDRSQILKVIPNSWAYHCFAKLIKSLNAQPLFHYLPFDATQLITITGVALPPDFIDENQSATLLVYYDPLISDSPRAFQGAKKEKDTFILRARLLNVGEKHQIQRGLGVEFVLRNHILDEHKKGHVSTLRKRNAYDHHLKVQKEQWQHWTAEKLLQRVIPTSSQPAFTPSPSNWYREPFPYPSMIIFPECILPIDAGVIVHKIANDPLSLVLNNILVDARTILRRGPLEAITNSNVYRFSETLVSFLSARKELNRFQIIWRTVLHTTHPYLHSNPVSSMSHASSALKHSNNKSCTIDREFKADLEQKLKWLDDLEQNGYWMMKSLIYLTKQFCDILDREGLNYNSEILSNLLSSHSVWIGGVSNFLSAYQKLRTLIIKTFRNEFFDFFCTSENRLTRFDCKPGDNLIRDWAEKYEKCEWMDSPVYFLTPVEKMVALAFEKHHDAAYNFFRNPQGLQYEFPHCQELLARITQADFSYEPSFNQDDRCVCKPKPPEKSCGAVVSGWCSFFEPRSFHYSGEHSEAFLHKHYPELKLLFAKENNPVLPNFTSPSPLITFSAGASAVASNAAWVIAEQNSPKTKRVL